MLNVCKKNSTLVGVWNYNVWAVVQRSDLQRDLINSNLTASNKALSKVETFGGAANLAGLNLTRYNWTLF